MRLEDPTLTDNVAQKKRDRLVELLQGPWSNENISKTEFIMVTQDQGRWHAD